MTELEYTIYKAAVNIYKNITQEACTVPHLTNPEIQFAEEEIKKVVNKALTEKENGR